MWMGRKLPDCSKLGKVLRNNYFLSRLLIFFVDAISVSHFHSQFVAYSLAFGNFCYIIASLPSLLVL